MPTPSPIRDASWAAKSGVSTTWLSRVITPSAQPSASSVAISGRAAATSDPNVNSSTIAAAKMPTPSEGPWLFSKRTISAPGPPCSTWSESLRAVNAASWTSFEVVGLDVVRALLVVERGDPDPAVLRQAAALAERARDAGHVLLRADLLERGLDARPVGRVLERAAARLVDDLVGVALGGGEVLGQQVVRALALGARQPEARDLLDADARGDDLDQDQGQQPDAERAPAVPVAQPGEPDEA